MHKLLSAILLTFGLLFASGQAHAQNPPPPQCGAGSINYNGDVDIAPPGGGNNDCIINGDVTATGYIRINAPTGKIVVTGNITASNHGNVILTAAQTVEVGGSIVVNNASAPLGQAGSVDIKANNAGTGPAFVIGSASSNGVAGTINTDTALGGGNDPFFIRGGIRIRNRNDITLTSMSALSVKGSASRSGVIILEATDGTLSLPTGTLSADGQVGQSAGAIVLQAHTITTQDGTIVSASDSVGQANHFVNLAASSVSFQGGTGLTIRANGGGSTANGTGSFAYALPEFGIFVTDDSTTNPQNFTWTVTYPFGTAYPGGLTWNGAVGSPLTFTANGTSHTQVLMTGYPLVFNGGDLLLASRGNEDHRVDLVYTGSTSGINGLVVNANKLTLNANATNATAGAGGDIFVSIPRPTSASPQQVLFTADGPTGASANGGTVQFFPKGDVTLGGNAGQFHLSAQSGSLGGNGGRATVSNKPFTTELASNTAVQVTARGQNGDGGYLELRSLFANFNGTGLKLAADAVGTGKGGQVILDVDGPITVGSGFGAVKLSAEASATNGSDGGKVTVISGSSASITSGQLSVKSGPTGSGGQLDLTIGGSLTLTGSLKADAGLAGNGHGGSVSVNAGDIALNGSSSGGGQALSADGAGLGAGGSVSLLLQASSQPTTIASQQLGALSLSANGGKDGTGAFSGAGGVIQLTDFNEGFIISGGALDVKSGPGQNAGSILVDAGTTLAVSGDLKAQGTGNGANGGTIRLTAQSDSDVVFSGTGPTNIIADGGQNGTTGNGGQITISNSGIGSIVFQNQVILSAAAEGSIGGTAGKVVATTAGGLVFGGAGSKVKANGGGVSGVTNIKLDAAGDIKIGSNAGEVELLAQGASPGARAGAIELNSQGEILVDGVRLKVKAGTNGDGGIAIATGRKITVNGDFEINGQGTGNGGTVSLNATDSSGLTLNGSLSANGGKNGGMGGSIDLFYAGPNALPIKSISATGSSNAGGNIRIHHTTDSDTNVTISGVVTTKNILAPPNDPILSGSFKLLPFDPNTNSVSLTVQTDDGELSSVLSAEGESVLVTVSSTILRSDFGIDTLKANNGGVGISAPLPGSGVTLKTGASITASENVVLVIPRVTNSGTITGQSVTIQSVSLFKMVNSGTIQAIGTMPDDTLEIVVTPGGFDIDISGGGVLSGNNVRIDDQSSSSNISFTGSQKISVPTADSVVFIHSNANVSITAGATVEAFSLDGGNLTLSIETAGLFNFGQLKSSSTIGIVSFRTSASGDRIKLVVNGNGDIFANLLTVDAWAADIQLNSIQNSNGTSAGLVTGSATDPGGGWSIVTSGNLLLGSIDVTAADLIAESQNGNLTLGVSSSLETILQGNVKLRATDGNILLGNGSSIRAQDGDVEVSLNGPPTNACQDSGGSIEVCRPTNVTVSILGGSAIYWGNPTPAGVAPQNSVSSDGQRIAFDRNGDSLHTITLGGNVTVSAQALP